MKAKRLWLSLLVCALCVGCANTAEMLGLHRKGAPAVPEPPVASADLQECRRELADFAARVLRQVYVLGVEAHSVVVGQAARAAEAVSGDLGAPAEPLPGVVLDAPEPVARVEKVLEQHAEEAAEFARAEYWYAERLKAYAKRPVETSWSIESGMLRAYLVMAGLGVGLLAALRWAWKQRSALAQVVGAVGVFLRDDGVSATAQAALKDALSKAEDRATEKVVAEIKAAQKGG